MPLLHVAMQMGPYHHPMSRTSGVWSLRILIIDQSFLLIVRTGRIVTASFEASSAGCSGFPAYSQMLTTLLPTWRAAIIYLRTVIVTAAIDQRFGRQLRRAPKGQANQLP